MNASWQTSGVFTVMGIVTKRNNQIKFEAVVSSSTII